MSEGEWELAVGLYAAALFSKQKPTAVSPRFDAPSFAQQWLELAVRAGDVRDAALMALTPTGQMDPKTKLPILEWRRYDDRRLAA